MKRFVMFLSLAILVVSWRVPLTPVTWGVHQFTIPGGPVVKVPALSGDAVGDLQSLPFEIIIVSYGWQRSVYLVYPNTILITVTAPWVFERSRYPLLEWIRSELDDSILSSSFLPMEELRIVKTEAWLWMDDEFFRLEQLISVVNDSLETVESIQLPQAALGWQVFNLYGEGLEYIIDDLQQISIPVKLSPGRGWSFALVLSGPLTKVAGYDLAECVLIVEESGVTEVTVRGQELHTKYSIISPAQGAIKLMMPR